MRNIALTLLAAMTFVSSTFAQRVPVPESRSDFRPSGPKAGAKDTRRVVQDFAQCLTRRNLSAVTDFLNRGMTSLSPALRSRAPDCLGASIESDESMLKGGVGSFRYALAEALITRKFGDKGIGDLSVVAPLDLTQLAPGQNPGLNALSECVIRRDPGGSWALLRTEAASPQEKTLFLRLAPAMQACVVHGTTLKMQAFFMRGAIAETYYLLSKAPRLPPGASR